MELLDKAQRWADHDPDPATASSLKADIEAAERGDEEALARVGAAMNGPLEFGTAGLRGVVGPGESRMNLAVVIRATAGLCQVVKAHATGTPTLVVGCDARYGSSEFATAACRVASAAGVRVLALPQANPTPLLQGLPGWQRRHRRRAGRPDRPALRRRDRRGHRGCAPRRRDPHER